MKNVLLWEYILILTRKDYGNRNNNRILLLSVQIVFNIICISVLFFDLEELIIIRANKKTTVMYKSPKYKTLEVSSAKDRQKYFRNLHDEVNKSRMAVQTITSFRNTETKFKKKIDDVQEELHNCVLRINSETKKNLLFKELITLMKGEMFAFQKTQKKQEEQLESEAQKKIKKLQYDIEQIFQKHNQQVAKITSLKEAASSNRSQRVVFSNLFKKLEKELKQTQELYKESLIKSQVAKDKACPKTKTQKLGEAKSDSQIFQSRQSETMEGFVMDSSYFSGSENDSAFITMQRYQAVEVQDFKRSYQKRSHTMKKTIHQHDQDQNKQSEVCELINEYEGFLQAIKVHMGFEDLDEALDYFESLQKNNESFAAQIDKYCEQIASYQHKIADMNVQKRNSECYEHSKQLPIGSCRRLKTLKSIAIEPEQNPHEESHQILLNLAQLCGKQVSPDCELGEDFLKQLDLTLDQVVQENKKSEVLKSQTDKNKRLVTGGSESNSAVDILLDRMERFSECEKLLDKNLFQQQYFKQFSKTKKSKIKR